MKLNLFPIVAVVMSLVLIWVIFLDDVPKPKTGKAAKAVSKSSSYKSYPKKNVTWHRVANFSIEKGDLIRFDARNST